MNPKNFLSSTELDSVLETFIETDLDVFGLKGLIISFSPLFFTMNQFNQFLTTISSVLGIIWLTLCIIYKVKDRNKQVVQEDKEENE